MQKAPLRRMPVEEAPILTPISPASTTQRMSASNGSAVRDVCGVHGEVARGVAGERDGLAEPCFAEVYSRDALAAAEEFDAVRGAC